MTASLSTHLRPMLGTFGNIWLHFTQKLKDGAAGATVGREEKCGAIGCEASKISCNQGCQIFLRATYQKGKMYQTFIKYIKRQQTMPNGSKLDQMDIKRANIFHCKTLPNLPKF
jgi:hypothetical protein